MSQYETIRKVIIHIVENKLDAPTLDELSASLGVSLSHLQKTFTEWVGITPKQFSRYLSLEYSKGLLMDGKSSLQAASRSGLSGGGRLHDLFVDIESVTPGEFKKKGEGLIILYSLFDTHFGLCLVASTDRGVCNVLFADTEEELEAEIQRRWKKATVLKKKDALHAEVEKYLSGEMPSSKIRLRLHGTNFQIKVWEALLSIPDGDVSTYGRIADKLGDRNLSRAVGTAIGDNPIGFIIPCHRVLKSTGEISGYRWGIERKRAMLAREACRLENKNDK